MQPLIFSLLRSAGLLGSATLVFAQEPAWIWHPTVTNATAAEVVLFRCTFRTPPYTWNARLTATADDQAEFFLNGRLVAACTAWEQPVRAEVSVNLNQGDNVLAVRARNASGPGGLLVHLNLGGERGAVVVSDAAWLTSTNESPGWNTLSFTPRAWQPAVQLGRHGMPPWGEILFRPSATPAESLQVAAGYQIELLRSARPDEGSWICLGFDGRGRLYLSAENPGLPLLRLSFDASNRLERVEHLEAPLGQAMGLLWAHDSLYVNGRGPRGAGLYRLTDTNRNDRFEAEELRLLKRFSVGGEHGYHALALGPDQLIYVLNGNATEPPEGAAANSPLRHYAEDVLSLNPDELGEVNGIPPPAGYIARTDPDGRRWELLVGGLRNAYGFDFNPDGELFTFDSDNEWNWGTPWYIPTRVLHCVSGADFGWRDGRRIWPEDYPDSLPPVVNVGIGSPCGVKFGTRSRFAPDHRRALFLQDWSYGRILAVHLTPHGASYRGTVEEFLRGRPLNLTAMDFGPDGALYFITGGRGTQSGLYRVRYVGGRQGAETARSDHESRDAGFPAGASPTRISAVRSMEGSEADRNATSSGAEERAAREARAIRRQLERFHSGVYAEAVDASWQHLGSSDAFLRHAARVALEAQPVATWRERALNETDTDTALTALLALARVGAGSDPAAGWLALDRFPLGTLNESQRLRKLRVLEVAIVRQGRPHGALANRLIAELDPHYPAEVWSLNRELTRLLLYLEAPTAVTKALELVSLATFPEEQMFYISQLRQVRKSWTLADRRRFLEWWHQPRSALRHPSELLRWFADVNRSYVDGALVDRHLTEMHADAMETLTADERSNLADLVDRPIAPAQLLPAVQRAFVKEWTVPDLLPHLERAAVGRDYQNGRQAFQDLQCRACHRLGDAGGAVGPELSGLASKYSRRDILESLLLPSKVLSDQYQNVTVTLTDGDEVTGRLVSDRADAILLETDWRTGAQTRVPRSQVREIRPSKLSPMPEGLLSVLTLEEILDLLAFLEAGGRAESPAFQPMRPR